MQILLVASIVVVVVFEPLVGFSSISIRQKQPPLARHSLTAADRPTGQLHSPQKIEAQNFTSFGFGFRVGVIMCRGLDGQGGFAQYDLTEDNLNEGRLLLLIIFPISCRYNLMGRS